MKTFWVLLLTLIVIGPSQSGQIYAYSIYTLNPKADFGVRF